MRTEADNSRTKFVNFKTMKGEKLKRILFKGDKIIWIVFFTLCAISWVEVFSATSRQTYETGSYWGPIIKHTGFLVGGIVIAWFIHTLKAKWIDKFTVALYWLGLAGLVWAQLSGTKLNDSARWITIPGIGMTIQPMEIAKMGVIMMIARILSSHQSSDGTDSKALVKILKYTIPPLLIIFKENFSSAVLLAFTAFFMMFIGRIPRKQLLKTIGIAAAGAALVVGIIWKAPQMLAPIVGENKAMTWHNRIDNFFDDEESKSKEDEDKNAQQTYSHIAVASSNIIGCGPGNSIQRDFIPHAYSDFIFAVIIEELGLLGAAVVILLYLTLLYRSGKIAKKCDDPYPAYLAMGIGMIIVMQALLHMYISVGDFVTGQPLPLMSQGGTSVLINCIYIGFLLSISQYADKNKKA